MFLIETVSRTPKSFILFYKKFQLFSFECSITIIDIIENSRKSKQKWKKRKKKKLQESKSITKIQEEKKKPINIDTLNHDFFSFYLEPKKDDSVM